ncbi:FAD-binding and (Fe-S)-binding domain-containing protein [Methylobacterium nodulans]|uniref:FAD linked oxidase domain protein n=1 Tax=Methylobacterium nodulans (strain LMG 21967 / CNCM I-2342 / ORS 2060) TaxID=460265 RepID=B8IFI5_METNO|nr:FAD-binding and (Fe-S)-binding domain-containing protein [Methylobacterium nodulans]ACL57720.1 FAD linked oxidase domain protein [Methylobacterium nodulans ORS 2060]
MHGSLQRIGAPGGEAALERALRAAVSGEVLTGAFDRGRYATDASIYQIMPRGVVLPKSPADIAATLAVAAGHDVPVILRGGGTSQNGQPIGAGLIVDCSRHLDRLLAYDREAGTVTVEPGMVLERLNARLKDDGWFFPVEPSTASRCTLGGMAGNNSCGARSLRYGKMVDNVLGLDGLLADGTAISLSAEAVSGAEELAARMLRLAQAERDEIERMFPKVQRRVGGYNLDALLAERPNLAHLLVGSEGTLAATTAITLKLARLPAHRVMGVCHFPSFRAAMETVPALVALDPVAVELVDNNVLVLGADIPLFRATLADITRGRPDCLLLVEFAGDEAASLAADLARLDTCMADHGFPGAVVAVPEPARQRTVWAMREACLNIMMSMRGDAKPVSFIEDCAVPLEHLADYTDAVTACFARHGTRGTWYAHASVGCLHVRPVLNLKQEAGVAAMRAIAEETAELVRRFKGSFSGEHGDGISRSEFIAPLFGPRLAGAFAAVKDAFDPGNRLNPGKIVRPLRMDDRRLMRFPEGYRVEVPVPALDWSAWGGLGGAVEMCNNNGTCRALAGGTMCPSYRVTRSEEHLTRGRANTLRLALSGQLGPEALTAPETKRALDLCVSCKGCRRECPTGVDMARMRIEVLHHYYARHGRPLFERLVAHLPDYAGAAAVLAPLLNLRDRIPALARLSERALGLAAARPLPRWRRPWRESGEIAHPGDVAGTFRDIVLFGDTFNRAFERENLEAAEAVLTAAGYRLHRVAAPGRGNRPLCCGRTFLAAGDVARARAEARRTRDALLPFVRAGARVVGLEPSCLLTFRDEFAALLPGEEAEALGRASLLFEELLAADLAAGRIALPLAHQGGRAAHLHGHCHQKAFGAMGAVEAVLRQVPGLEVRPVESSCCGMAGAFGYRADRQEVSRAMAELSLFPALRRAAAEDLVVADGTSCRHQIRDGLGREALHVARVLHSALEPRQSYAR